MKKLIGAAVATVALAVAVPGVAFAGFATPTPKPSTPKATVPTVVIPPGTPTGVVVPGSAADQYRITVGNQFGFTSVVYGLVVQSLNTTCSAPVETKPGNTSVWAYCALPA